MKENVMPPNSSSGKQKGQASGRASIGRDVNEQGKVLVKIDENMSSPFVHGYVESRGVAIGDDMEETKMDCGNVVRVFAFTGGRKEEIGKAIVMGLAGTKFARKVIPQGWRCIKLTSYTTSGALKICPFPPGWTEQLKNQTVKEADGRSILWPDMLLESLVQKAGVKKN